MPLFVDIQTGFPLEAEADVATGATTDAGNVSFNAISDPSAVQVAYVQTVSGFGQNRLAGLVGVGSNIVVTGVDSSFVLNGGPISNSAGLTFVDSFGIIRCVYDVTQCGGSNYFVFDSGGNQISFPNFVLIGHEMSHAFHIAIGDLSSDPEFQAETDENGYRSQNGLTLRDPTNHAGGCGLGGGGGTTITCLIASAAYGSPLAPQLFGVRMLRDMVLRKSLWAQEFFQHMHEEYYRFSPQVSARMYRSPEVRESLAAMIVEPYFEFMAILRTRAQNPGPGEDEGAVARIRRFATGLPKAGVSLGDAALIAGTLRALRTRLPIDVDGEDHQSAVFDPPAGANCVGILRELCNAVAAVIPANGYVTWALLEPLIIFWESVAELAKVNTVIGRVDDWLAAAPLPSAYASLCPEEVQADLLYLNRILFTSATVREIIAQRVAKVS